LGKNEGASHCTLQLFAEVGYIKNTRVLLKYLQCYNLYPLYHHYVACHGLVVIIIIIIIITIFMQGIRNYVWAGIAQSV